MTANKNTAKKVRNFIIGLVAVLGIVIIELEKAFAFSHLVMLMLIFILTH